MAENLYDTFGSNYVADTWKDRLADRITRFLGTWTFIILNFSFFLGWIAINTCAWFDFISFDKAPFILLNLFLSMLAAFENPIILMSANRLERLDNKIAHANYQLSINSDIMLKEIIDALQNMNISQQDLIEAMKKNKESFKRLCDHE